MTTMTLKPTIQKITEGIKTMSWNPLVWIEKWSGNPLGRKDKIILGMMLVLFLFVFYIMLDANKYPATVHVIEGKGKVGVNPTSLSLDFGDLSQGSSMVRRVEVKNGTPIPMFIAVLKIGGISSLVDIDKNFFRVAPHTDTKIEFSMYMPASAPIDSTYNGRVFLFKIPTFGL